MECKYIHYQITLFSLNTWILRFFRICVNLQTTKTTSEYYLYTSPIITVCNGRHNKIRHVFVSMQLYSRQASTCFKITVWSYPLILHLIAWKIASYWKLGISLSPKTNKSLVFNCLGIQPKSPTSFDEINLSKMHVWSHGRMIVLTQIELKSSNNTLITKSLQSRIVSIIWCNKFPPKCHVSTFL